MTEAHPAQRVLVVASELPPGPGGIGAHALAVSLELAAQGRDVAVLGSQHYTSSEERTTFNAALPIPLTTLSDGPDPFRTAQIRFRELRDAVADFEPDVVLASGGRVLWLTALARHSWNLPIVAVTHGTELGGAAWHQQLTRRALDRFDRVIAVSNFTAGLARNLGVKRNGIDVIPNGADGERFARNAARREAFRSVHDLGDCPVVLTVGNITERKGQHLVVGALPRLIAAVPDVMYVLVGQPTNFEALQQQAQRLGVIDHMLILGQVEAAEVVDAHCAADVFAMTSTSTGSGDVEGFGIAVLEAALCGVPAVVTKGTGAEEAVHHGETGIAVDSDPSAIADALAGLLTDATQRRAMGMAAERQARGGATWTHRAEQYGEILDESVRGSKPRMVVISHTEHWRNSDGDVVGFGATTRELDYLAGLVSELVHVAPLYPGDPPAMARTAEADNARLVSVVPAGGDGLRAKLGALLAVPRWAATINREVSHADVVHIRCPAGISMVALAVLFIRRRPRDRWVKYAGNWAPETLDARTYRLQRWWLSRGLAGAAVTVNGHWPEQPPWVHTFDNPTLTQDEIKAGRKAAEGKPFSPPWRVVFAGRLDDRKGADQVVEAVVDLRGRGLDVSVDLVGDGPLRRWVEAQADAIGHDIIRHHGWLPRSELEAVLAKGHLFLLPSASEGFPKVVAEAMAFGCVPVASATGGLGQTLSETGGAVVLPANARWADEVEQMLSDPAALARLAAKGIGSVERFSFDTYLESVRAMASNAWRRQL